MGVWLNAYNSIQLGLETTILNMFPQPVYKDPICGAKHAEIGGGGVYKD